MSPKLAAPPSIGGGSTSSSIDNMWVNVTWMPHSSLSPTLVSLKVRSVHANREDSTKTTNPEDWRVTIAVHGMAGLPLSVSSSTPASPLRPCGERCTDEDEKDASIEHTLAPSVARATHDCHWDHILQLPIRWRDLPRDAYLALDVVGPTHAVLFHTTLALFDGYGKLCTGLQRLELKAPSCHHTPHNPGLSPQRPNEPSEWNEDDPVWKASCILDQLERLDKSSSRKEIQTAALPDATPMTSVTGNDPVSFGQIPSVPWLDAITKQHCRQILANAQEQDAEDVILSIGKEEKLPSYLILELPIFDVPVMHEDTVYPVPPQGASGSVSALDLSLYRQNVKRQGDAEEKNEIDDLELVPFLDHENEHDNPVEDKYRTLAHDLLRGLVDPALKPDREQRARLASIIASPSHHPTREEKDLLWRFRFSLVDNRRALTKFLLAVDWTVESEVVQAAELLEQWRKRSPIEVTDALKLLGKHVAFQTSLVRAYAIDTLAAAPDDELRLYLLQLVQALKYENTSTTDRLSSNMGASTTPTGATTGSSSGSASSLANFLIDRASASTELANYLYWYLKVELQDPTHGARYREVFSLLQQRLSVSPLLNAVSGSSMEHSPGSETNQGSISHGESGKEQRTGSFMAIVDSVSKLGSSLRGSEHAPDSGVHSRRKVQKSTTVWDILIAQDHFISGIMDCQMQSRDARGKRDEKESHLKHLLSSEGFERMQDNDPVPLPSAPHIAVKGVNPRTAKMFKSALYPALVEFRVDENASSRPEDKTEFGPADVKYPSKSPEKMGGIGSPRSGHSLSTYKVIVKTGDDLRQDQLVIMMIQLMDGLLKRGTLDLCLKPYSIIATSASSGLVEFVDGSIPISQILASHNNSIMHFFQACAPHNGAKYDIQPEVMQRYVRSCAGYCVITYILGVGDRHLDNIMLQPSGHFFHIDFGFIFGRDPKPLPPAFRLTREMVDGMGGMDSAEYRQFCSLACQAFNILRKSAGLVLNLLQLMCDAGIEDLSNNPSADAEGVISKVEERFRLELTDEQAERFFLGLINDSLYSLAPRVMDVFHSLAVARR